MATTMTLAALRARAQERANMEDSGLVTDAEWTTLLNGSAFALYDLLVASYGDDYFETNGTITTDGTDRIALPAGVVYKLTGVEILIAGSGSTAQYQTLQRFKKGERNTRSLPGVAAPGDWSNLRYRESGEYLWLTPIATSGQTIRIWYVPRWIPLSAEADTFDGISGWLEWVIADAARKALIKEESDTAAIERELAELRGRIVAMAANRDQTGANRVTDVHGQDGAWSHGGGW